MTRIQPLTVDTAEGRAKDLLEAVQKKLGRSLNMTGALAAAPAALDGYLQFSGALAKGSLPPRIREQIALTVAEANGCEYCLAAHTAIGGSLGLSKDQVTAARRGTSDDAGTAALLRLAHRVVETRGQVNDADIQAVRDAGFGDDAITEVVAHVALNVLTNFFNNVAHTPVDFPAAPELALA